MSKKANTNSVYIANLDRFGYTLEVAARTENEAVDLLMKEYLDAYMRINDGEDPREEEGRYGDTYYNEAKEDIEVYCLEFGKVEWR